MPDPGEDAARAAARARIRGLVDEALAQGRPTAWFERLYAEADGDASAVPWADAEPHPCLAAWLARGAALEGVRRAVVVGCGLGQDAEHLARRGVEVTAFDVAPHAVAWARRLHPGSAVRYEVGDLLEVPTAWRGAFDLVVEVYTLQALPAATRPRAAAGLRALTAPGGRVFVATRLRAEEAGSPDEAVVGPPWPLSRAELRGLLLPFAVAEDLVEGPEPKDPALVRAFGVWRRGQG